MKDMTRAKRTDWVHNCPVVGTLVGILLQIFAMQIIQAQTPASQSFLASNLRCQRTIDNVSRQIRGKGVRQTSFAVNRRTANQGRTGNPTNRTDELIITLIPFFDQALTKPDRRSSEITTNILTSAVLMKNWADKIVSDCSNIAIVNFNEAQTDFSVDFYIQSDGSTKLQKCIDAGNNPNILPWGVSVCP